MGRWLNGDSQKGVSMFKSLECMNVTLFEQRVFADIITVRTLKSSWITQVNLNHMTVSLLGQRRRRHRGEGSGKMEAEIGVVQL